MKRLWLYLVCAGLAYADLPLSVSPTSVVVGKEYSIVLRDSGCAKTPAAPVLGPKEEPRFGTAPGYTFSALVASSDRCEFTYTLKVGNDASLSPVQMPLLAIVPDAVGKPPVSQRLLETVEFSAAAVQRGPIPPGVDPKGEVDLAYDILPYRVTSDNFGRRVAETYFAVEATVGNNTGYKLLLTSLFFRPTIFTGKGAILALTPNTQYGAVRSTLEREQQVGRRAITVGVTRGIIPMLAASTPLLAMGFTSEFAVATTLYGLGEKVFELVYPDKTVRQLIALDSRTFRDGMVLNSNEQKPILFFIHREIVMCAVKDPNCAKSDAAPTRDPLLANRLNFAREFNPAKVKLKLGALNLIGEKVQFANRLVVSSIDESKVGVTPPATVYTAKITADIAQGGSANIEVTGNNLNSISLSSTFGDAFKIDAPKLAADGSFATIKVNVPEDMRPGSYTVAVNSPNGTVNLIPVTVLPAKPEPVLPQIPADLPNKKAVELEITGKFLKFVAIDLADGSDTDVKLDKAKTDCSSGTCKITLKPELGFADNAVSPAKRTLKLQFTNPALDPAKSQKVTLDLVFNVKK